MLYWKSLPSPQGSKRPKLKVHFGDCTRLLQYETTDDRYDLVFADPPFNINQPYEGYADRRDYYGIFTFNWFAQCWESCKGVLVVHGTDALAEQYLAIARRIGIADNRIAWVNWHYRFGQCNTHNWIDSRCHCLIYAKDPKVYTWNPEAVMVESDRVAYGDKRTLATANPGKRLPGTVWGVPSDGPYWGRVQGNSKERRHGHPNQLPELYLERLLRAYTNPGDLVLDPFGGSGTTIVVAAALGRHCDTIEVSEMSLQVHSAAHQERYC